MNIGTVRERKQHEYRVGITPDNVSDILPQGIPFILKLGHGCAGFPDADYIEAGASASSTMEDVHTSVDMMVKVKEPLRKSINFYVRAHSLCISPSGNGQATG